LPAFSFQALAFGSSVLDRIPLWPKGAPDEKGNIGQEHDTTKSGDELVSVAIDWMGCSDTITEKPT
jgi:hypothetical protein